LAHARRRDGHLGSALPGNDLSYGGTYKGTRFRSLLELSVILHLEGQGLTLGSTMLYEAHRVPYGRQANRTYIVDLSLPERRQLIEVKPLSRVLSPNNWAKRKAAQAWALANGCEYLVVTERELQLVGAQLVSLDEASRMPGVVLGEKAARAMRRKMRRAKR